MNGKLRAITGRELIGALRRLGFEVIRSKGSHFFLRHPDGRRTVVPVYRGETIGKGLVGQILRDCELTSEELRKFLYHANAMPSGYVGVNVYASEGPTSKR